MRSGRQDRQEFLSYLDGPPCGSKNRDIMKTLATKSAMKRFVGILLIVGLFAANGYSYGPRGHRLVGAIADKRLAKNAAVAAKVSKLLGGLSLATVATFPDSIKSWDPCGGHPGNSPVTSVKRINKELHAFVKANPCNGNPSHREFHFTDVPVVGHEKYADGTVGRSQFDIVHMIPFCIRVLKGTEPANNPRAITKSVAVILLAHYLGDIHQPLHVGAEYFDKDGKPFEPTASNPGFADQGGNKLTLFLLAGSGTQSVGNLHGFWDTGAVNAALGNTPDTTVAQQLADSEPVNWKLTGDTENWAEAMANDILPIAADAHERLNFKNIKITTGAHDIISGDAVEKKKSVSYQKFAGDTVKGEIQKGGWRLAALLEELLQ